MREAVAALYFVDVSDQRSQSLALAIRPRQGSLQWGSKGKLEAKWLRRRLSSPGPGCCVCVCVRVRVCVCVCAYHIIYHESLPYTYCTHAMLCTMHVFSAFIWPFHCIHIALTKDHAACRRPKSFVRRCTSETILTSADAACGRPVSFLRMMHRWIMAPELQPKERLANRPKGRPH